jgi:hypothetical protein
MSSSTCRDERALGLEGPNGYGEFAGHLWIRCAVTWTLVARPLARNQSMSAAADEPEQTFAV